jgi:hypothetical protein
MTEIIHESSYGSPDMLEIQDASKPTNKQGRVLENWRLASRQRLARRCAVAAAVLFGTLASFQAALAVGIPWGEAAWGGAHAELSVGMRIGSGVQVVLAIGFALIVLRRAGHRVWSPLPLRWLPVATRILTGYMALGFLMNAASRSSIERAIWTPVGFSLAVLCGIVAVWSPRLSAMRPDDPDL